MGFKMGMPTNKSEHLLKQQPTFFDTLLLTQKPFGMTGLIFFFFLSLEQFGENQVEKIERPVLDTKA